MRRGDERLDRSIDDTEVGSIVDLEVSVNDTTKGALQHDASSRVVSERRPGSVLDKVLDLSIGLDISTGEHVNLADTLAGRGVGDLAPELERLNHDVEVEGVGEGAEVDDGQREGVLGGDIDEATGEGLLDGDGTTSNTASNLDGSGVVGGKHSEKDGLLESETSSNGSINVTEVGAGGLEETLGDDLGEGDEVGKLAERDEGESVALSNGDGASLVGTVLSPGSVTNGRVLQIIEGSTRDRTVGEHGTGEHGGVVLQVLTDTGEVNDGGDAELLELLLGADTGKLEKAGSKDGTTGEDNLAPSGDGLDGSGSILAVLDTGNLELLARLGSNKLGSLLLGQKVVVGASLSGLVVCGTGVRAGAVDLVERSRNPESTNGIAVGTVLGGRDAKLPHGAENDLVHGVEVGIRRLDRTAGAVGRRVVLNAVLGSNLGRGVGVALRLLEVGEEVVPGPAAVAESLPRVVVTAGVRIEFLSVNCGKHTPSHHGQRPCR